MKWSGMKEVVIEKQNHHVQLFELLTRQRGVGEILGELLWLVDVGGEAR